MTSTARSEPSRRTTSQRDTGKGSRRLPTLRLVATPSSEGAATDEQLFRDFRAHDDLSAFDAIVHRYERELFAYLRRYLGSAESAEDVFQATFLKVYVNRLQFEEGRSFRPWLYAVATHQAIDSRRRVQSRRMLSLDQGLDRDSGSGTMSEWLSAAGGSAAEVAEEHESTERVRAAIEALPGALRETLLLIYYRGMKYRQAASVLGIPVGTVKSRLHAALVRLGGSLRGPDETSAVAAPGF
jgi:RNA polymerase sigma-70 factor (ECF subfamily)